MARAGQRVQDAGPQLKPIALGSQEGSEEESVIWMQRYWWSILAIIIVLGMAWRGIRRKSH